MSRGKQRDWSIDNRHSNMPRQQGEPWYARKVVTSHPIQKLVGVTLFGLLAFGLLSAFVPEQPQRSEPTVASDSAPSDSHEAAAQPKAAARPAPKLAPQPQPKPRSRPQPRPQPRPAPVAVWPVTDVVDGDTVHVLFHGIDESVRVIGIDTPETVHPTEPVECGGPAASAAAQRLLEGQEVHLVFDPSQGRRDVYGRMLAYVEIPGVGDFGKIMLHQGHAAEYTYDTAYARRAQYLRAQGSARAHQLGVWAECGGVDTPLRQQAAPAPAPAPAPLGAGGDCDPSYRECLPVFNGNDLDCADVDGPIHVVGDDPYGLDGDGDGTGCDS